MSDWGRVTYGIPSTRVHVTKTFLFIHCMCGGAPVWVENNLQELVLSFHREGPEGEWRMTLPTEPPHGLSSPRV